MMWCKVQDSSVWSDTSTSRYAIRCKSLDTTSYDTNGIVIGTSYIFSQHQPGYSYAEIGTYQPLGWFGLFSTWSVSSNETKAYLSIDGIVYNFGSGTCLSNMVVPGSTQFGCGASGTGVTGDRVWKGQLSDMCIWNYPLTLTQITNLAQR